MSHSSKREPQSGFALIIALSLMSFILLLLVSVSSLVRLETSAAASSKNTIEARQMALMGAAVAVGNLQKYAGPDQRVTATGDILSDTDATKAKFTGIWDADPGTLASPNPDYGKTLNWLVSRDPAAIFNAATFQRTATSSTDDIELVSERRSGAIDEVEAVRATPVEILDASDNVVGEFAWWVGDEGVKARVNLANEEDTPSGIAKTLGERTAPEALFSNASLADSFTAALDRSDPAEAGSAPIYKASNYDSLSMLGSTPAETTAFSQVFADSFHELTTYSLGLLTNTKQGGLKEDLTTLFEADDTVFQSSDVTNILALGDDGITVDPLLFTDYNPDGIDAAHLFAVPVGSGERIPGPTWNLLRDYYRQYIRVDYTTGALDPQRALPRPESNHSEIGIRALHDSADGFGNWNKETVYRSQGALGNSSSLSPGNYPVIRPTSNKVHPVITEMQYLISYRIVPNPSIDADPATPDDYELQLVIDPIITLWNPYNIDLDLSDYAVTVHSRGLPVRIQLTIDPDGAGPEPAAVRTINFIDLLGGANPAKSYVASVTNVTLGAGEVKTFSPNNLSPGPQTANLNLTEGWNQAGGLYAERIANDGTERVTGSIDAGITNVVFQHDDSTWIDPFYTRVWLMDTTLGSQFDTIGENKPQSFETTEIRVESAGYEEVAGDMAPIDFVFAPVDVDVGPILNGAKTPFGLLRFHLQAENEFEGRLAQYSPMAYITNIRSTGISSSNVDYPIVPNWGLEMPNSVNGYNAVNSGYFGSSRSATGGSNNVQIFDIPRAPLHSLAQLQHADASIFAVEPMYMIGNSYASPYIPAGDTVNEYALKLADMSYYANEALWDRFFFSTAADSDPVTNQGGTGTPHRNAFESFLSDPQSNPLPNPRVWPMPSDLTPGAIADSVFSATSATGFRETAKYVGIKGGFNINSTSVDAWRAILSSTRDKSVSGSSDFSRFSDPNSTSTASGEWTGYLSLTDAQIDSLAQEIVDRIRNEGPFLSLADFINRNPDGSSAQQQAGLLQRAIDATTVNSGFSTTGLGISAGEAIAANSVGKVAAGAATYLSQADLLTAIGSFISPRSDTFTIRAQGAAFESFGSDSQSTARVEMVVQRVPKEIEIDGNLRPNERAFRIVGMRWLNEDEI